MTILIQNASHFLDSAIDQLSVSKDATNLHLSSQPYNRTPTSDHRNSLIFVAASVELLLKAKLATIHWSQIFEDPGKAQIEKLESQNLISVKASDLCSRITRLTRERSTPRQPRNSSTPETQQFTFLHPKPTQSSHRYWQGSISPYDSSRNI